MISAKKTQELKVMFTTVQYPTQVLRFMDYRTKWLCNSFSIRKTGLSQHFRLFILLRACDWRTIDRRGERMRVACGNQDAMFLCIKILMALSSIWVFWEHLKMQVEATNAYYVWNIWHKIISSYCFKINKISWLQRKSKLI